MYSFKILVSGRLILKSRPLLFNNNIYDRRIYDRILYERKNFTNTTSLLMKSYIQIIGSGTFDVNPSVLIHYDNQKGSQRYLFNCGEGTQRICLQNKLRSARIRNIF